MKQQLTQTARDLRKRQTVAEGKLWYAIRNRQIDGFKFKRQVPRGPYVVDFLCLEAGLVVEVDGGQHAEAQSKRDDIRSSFLENEGLRVLRFWNNEVIGNVDGVLVSIRQALQESPAPSPGAARHPLPEGRGVKSASGQ